MIRRQRKNCDFSRIKTENSMEIYEVSISFVSLGEMFMSFELNRIVFVLLLRAND